MPSGGKRPRAGRKPTFVYFKKIDIGADCERLWQEACDRSVAVALSDKTSSVAEEWEIVQAVPIHNRSRWIEKHYDSHKIDVEIALRIDQGLSDEECPRRVLTIIPKRPWGIRKQIYARVAAKHGISPSVAEKYHKEFRRFQRETD